MLQKQIAVFCIGLGLLISCQHSSPPSEKKDIPKPLPNEYPHLGQQLTFIGNNEAPQFSPDGRSIIFASSRRELHTNSQIYELSLDTNKEKRITYQDGDCSSPIYTLDGKKIIYASTTDELKERPALLYVSTRRSSLPPSELYLSDLMGNEISRLTNQNGFQGQPSWIESRPPSLLFLSHMTGQMSLHKADAPYLKSSPLFNRDKMISSAISSASTLVWIEHPENSEEMSILTKRKDKIDSLTLPVAKYQGLTWLDSKEEIILFSSDLKISKINTIYAYHLKKSCLIPLVESTQSLTDPRPSPDRKKLLYTAQLSNGTKQLFLKEMDLTNVNCPQ